MSVLKSVGIPTFLAVGAYAESVRCIKSPEKETEFAKLHVD